MVPNNVLVATKCLHDHIIKNLTIKNTAWFFSYGVADGEPQAISDTQHPCGFQEVVTPHVSRTNSDRVSQAFWPTNYAIAHNTDAPNLQVPIGRPETFV